MVSEGGDVVSCIRLTCSILGYKRTKTRAETCKGFYPYSDSSNYTKDVAYIAIALRKLLTPLLHMSKSPGRLPRMSDELCDDLFETVTDAGQLSREMRLCEDVIYHWSSTFNDGMRAHLIPKQPPTDVVHRGV